MLRKTWNKAAQGDFLYKLGVLMKQGYTLNRSFLLLRSQTNQKGRAYMDEALEKLSAGSSLSEALTVFHFPNEVLSAIMISAVDGQLVTCLIQNGIYLKKRAEWSERFNRTLRYPVFLLFLTSWIAILFYQFLYPQFLLLYESLQLKTPVFTSMMFSFLAHIPMISLILLFFILFIILLTFMIKKSVSPTFRVEMMLWVPFLRRWNSLVITHFFSMNVGTMLKSGISVTDALILLKENAKHDFFKEESTRIQQGLINGRSLSTLIRKKRFYNNELPEIIDFGQAHGELGNDLIQYADWLFSELEQRINDGIKKMQPVFFAIIGCFVLLLFVSMFLPMFKLMDAL